MMESLQSDGESEEDTKQRVQENSDFETATSLCLAEATKKAQRLANLGNQHFKGKTHTKEYRERLSQMMKERRTDTMGHFTPHTEKTKKKISKKLMGHKKTNYGGYKLSAETRERMRQSALNRKHKY